MVIRTPIYAYLFSTTCKFKDLITFFFVGKTYIGLIFSIVVLSLVSLLRHVCFWLFEHSEKLLYFDWLYVWKSVASYLLPKVATQIYTNNVIFVTSNIFPVAVNVEAVAERLTYREQKSSEFEPTLGHSVLRWPLNVNFHRFILYVFNVVCAAGLAICRIALVS